MIDNESTYQTWSVPDLCPDGCYPAIGWLHGQTEWGIRDLEFTITKTEELPEELQKMLEEKKEENFSFTYSDNEYLYIAKGYGIQETGGYSVSVDDCYLTKTNIVVKTRLHGPAVGEDVAKTPSYPNIVLKMELCDREVIFE